MGEVERDGAPGGTPSGQYHSSDSQKRPEEQAALLELAVELPDARVQRRSFDAQAESQMRRSSSLSWAGAPSAVPGTRGGLFGFFRTAIAR
ncbi:MAG: hypothetical protein IPK65_11905 [Gammaproteobacteria bacterium]|nr:hypothetical protein [Gammaproteobacteria bacterium]